MTDQKPVARPGPAARDGQPAGGDPARRLDLLQGPAAVPSAVEILVELGFRKKSLGRLLMNCQVRRALRPVGDVLDLGSGGAPSYRLRYLDTSRVGRYMRADLDATQRPDLVFDLEAPFPIKSVVFDTVLLMNVSYAVYDLRAVLREIARILRPGGVLYVWAPFLGPIISGPADYARYSSRALERMLGEAGFVRTALQPAGGPFTAMWGMAQRLLRPAIVAAAAGEAAVALDGLLRLLWGQRLDHLYPVGYLVAASR